MADGKRVDVQGVGQPAWIHRADKFPNLNRERPYETKMLNDSVAYLGIGTFELNQVQVEEIGAFFRSISGVPNLIIDVRNNGGGHDWVIGKLYSYIAGEPMTLNGYSRVGSNSTYGTFNYALNYTPDMRPFADYKPEADGFYLRAENVVKPDSEINYKG